MLSNWPKLLDHFLSSTVFPFSSFCLYVGNFRLIGYKSLSPNLSLYRTLLMITIMERSTAGMKK